MDMSFGFDLRRAARDRQPAIANLLQLYLYEFSAELGTDVEPDGRFAWDGLNDYWTETDLHPFLMTVEGKLAGFALVQRILASDGTLVWDVEDFFVMARFRRSGLGTFAACCLFDRFAGPWQVRVLSSNDRALAFWRAAIAERVPNLAAPATCRATGRRFAIFRFEI